MKFVIIMIGVSEYEKSKLTIKKYIKMDSKPTNPGILFEDDQDDDPEAFYIPELTSRTNKQMTQSQVSRKVSPRKVALSHYETQIDFQPVKQQQQVEQQQEVPIELRIERMFSNLKSAKNFVYCPTQNGRKITMSMVLNKTLRSPLFVCKIPFQGRQIILATKKQQGLVNTKYEISLLPDFVENITSEPFFVGLMVEQNHGIYNLTDDGRFPVHNNEMIWRRLGGIMIHNNVLSSPQVVMFTPKVKNGVMSIIQSNHISNFFQLILRQTQPPLEKYENLTTTKGQMQQIIKQIHCRQSKKSLVIKNTARDNYSMILGRVGDTQYKIDLQGGLSPFQAFGLSVLWLSSC